jgi:hypothetical protein
MRATTSTACVVLGLGIICDVHKRHVERILITIIAQNSGTKSTLPTEPSRTSSLATRSCSWRLE